MTPQDTVFNDTNILLVKLESGKGISIANVANEITKDGYWKYQFLVDVAGTIYLLFSRKVGDNV